MYGQTRPIFIGAPRSPDVRRLVARRSEAAAGIAVVAPGAVAADPAGDLVARVAAALAQLVAERAELAGRLVERAAVLGRAGLDRAPEVRGVAAREGRPAGPDRLEGVGVAVADVGQPVVVGEADDAAMPRLAEAGRVERLEGVGLGGRVGVVEQAAQHPALGAQRVRHERMGRDGQTARLMDGQDRRPERAVGPDRAVEVEAQQVAAEGRDLLADDDLGAQAAVAGDRLGGDGRIDPLVVGDGDDVEVGACSTWSRMAVDAGRAIAGEGVDVQVRPAARAVAPAGRRRIGEPPPLPRARSRAASAGGAATSAAGASRSGQIGKKTAHHWSGASAMRSSNAAARRVIVVVTRSRRVPSAGTSIGMILPRKVPCARAPDGHAVDRHARLHGEHRRTHRHQRRAPRRAGSGSRRRSGRGRRRARPGCRCGARRAAPRRASRRPTSRMPATPRVRSK